MSANEVAEAVSSCLLAVTSSSSMKREMAWDMRPGEPLTVVGDTLRLISMWCSPATHHGPNRLMLWSAGSEIALWLTSA